MHRGDTNCRAEIMMIGVVLLAAAGALVLTIVAVNWMNTEDGGEETGTGLARAVLPESSEADL